MAGTAEMDTQVLENLKRAAQIEAQKLREQSKKEKSESPVEIVTSGNGAPSANPED